MKNWSPTMCGFFAVLLLLCQVLPSLAYGQGRSFFTINSPLPSLNLTLTPHFDRVSEDVTSIHIQILLENPNVKENKMLVTASLFIGNVPCNQYDEGALRAFDGMGELPLALKDDNTYGTRSWLPTRDTKGSVILELIALPREVNGNTPPGPRLDLRANGGGMLGTGICFIPLPPDEKQVSDINLRWNLTGTPEGTSAVWTFGEEDFVHKQGLLGVISNSVYAVGPMNQLSTTIPGDSISRRNKEFGMYWFDEPPFNVTQLASQIQYLFFKMATFFEDQEDAYRVFIRKAPVGVGGSAYLRSFVLEYDGIHRMGDDLLFNLIAHEMVHNWPIMQETRTDLPEDPDSAWYTEGIAQFYADMLPYRFGVHSDEQLLADLNKDASAYYTSPVVNITNQEYARIAWTNGHAQRIPYYRGMMYLVKVDAQIRTASGGRKSVDDIMIELLRRRNRHEYHGIDIWLELLQNELGPASVIEYQAMTNGYLIVPAKDCLGERFELVRSDQEQYELGFALDFMSKRVIYDLVPDSRAEKAGVRNGDKVLSGGLMWFTADDISKNMTLTVERDGEVLEFEYWPRSYEKVECYQWVLKEQDEVYDGLPFSQVPLY